MNPWFDVMAQWGIPTLVAGAGTAAVNSWRNARAAKKAAPDVAVAKTLERAASVQALQDGLFENQKTLLEAATHRAEAAEHRAEAAEHEATRLRGEVQQLRGEIAQLRSHIAPPTTAQETP